MESEKEAEAAEHLVSALNADAKWLAMVKETYDVKAEANPGRIPPFAEWVRATWAGQNAREASYLPGGVTRENALVVARTEYFGDGAVSEILKERPSADWMSYVCEGTVNYRFDVPRADEDGAEKIRKILSGHGCSDAEIVYDFDPDFLSVIGSRPFAGETGGSSAA